MKHLLWILFHPGSWKIYREIREYSKISEREDIGIKVHADKVNPDEFPYPECFGCDAFMDHPINDCKGVRHWIECGFLLRGATVKIKEKP